VGKAAKESRREEPKQRKAIVTVASVRRRGKNIHPQNHVSNVVNVRDKEFLSFISGKNRMGVTA